MSIDLVLCATDLSLEEGAAWRAAARLVQALNARARILHVIEPVTFPYPAEGPGREELREKLRSDLLSEARRAVRARLASLEREWAEGYRADKIEAVTVRLVIGVGRRAVQHCKDGEITDARHVS